MRPALKHRQPHSGETDAGMTLLEMLAVLVIMAVATVMAVPLVRPPSPERILETAAIEISQRARAVRAAAIATNGEGSLLVDVDGRTIATRIADASAPLPGGRPLQLPSGMTLSITSSAADLEPGRIAAIRFFADGSSSGGRITLQLAERRYVVAVDWLSGRVTGIRPAPSGGGP